MESNSPGIRLGKLQRKNPSTLAKQSPTSDTDGTGVEASLVGNFGKQEVKIPWPGANRVSVREAETRPTMEKLSPRWTAAGFVLMDSSLSSISYNTEAAEILSYPDKSANSRHADIVLAKICSTLLSGLTFDDALSVSQFQSGRRRYFCRAFLMDAHADDRSHSGVVILLERGNFGLVPLLQVSKQFNLTQREGEALAHLLRGLRSKEIANRMNISPNTVKAFMRTIMVKTRVSSRSALFGKIMMTQTP